MRQRHQAILINSQAKKKICNNLSLDNYSYEIEQKKLLDNFFKESIDDEDVEIINKGKNEKLEKEKIKEEEKENVEEEENEENDEEEENEEDEEDDIGNFDEDEISLKTNIKVPPLGEQKGPYIKYKIKENSYVGGINYEDYIIIPQNKLKIINNNSSSSINIKKEEETVPKNTRYKVRSEIANRARAKASEKPKEAEATQNNNNDIKNEDNKVELNAGSTLNFNNILEQMAYWAEELNFEKSGEKDKNKYKKKTKDVELPGINVLQLFKLFPNKIDSIKGKIQEIEKDAKDKNILVNSAVKNLLSDQATILENKKQDMRKLCKEIERVNTITYSDDFSIIEFK